MYNFSQRNILKKQLHAQLPGISWFVSICSVSRLFWECLGVGGCSGRADGSLLSLVKRSGCSGWPFCWEGCRSACCPSAVLWGGIAPHIQHDQVLCFPCWFHFHLYLGRALEVLKGTVGSNDINLFSFVLGTVATEITRAGLWKISIQGHLQLPPEDATSPFPFLFSSALVSFPVQRGQRPWVCGRVTRALSCELRARLWGIPHWPARTMQQQLCLWKERKYCRSCTRGFAALVINVGTLRDQSKDSPAQWWFL